MTESLSNVDAAWLRMEDPTNLMMVTCLLRFDEPLDLQRLRATVETRLLIHERFRQRVVPSPFGLGRPHWKLDDEFDLDAHLHRIALPAPGGDQALQALVSDLMSTPFDLSKPLWQVHLVEGCEGGGALVARLHHCIGDGMALIQLMLALTDGSPRPANRAPVREGGGPQATRGARLRRCLGLLADLKRITMLAMAAASGLAILGRLVLTPPDPPTAFKGPLGVRKRAAWSAVLPLPEVKEIGRRMGGTVNDVLLTAVAGALRRYLADRGEEVPRSLTLRAAIPVNLRPGAATVKLGNQFGLVFLRLPVGIPDAAERLAELRRRMDALKRSPEALVTFAALNVAGLIPGRLQSLAVGFLGSKLTAVMTNVPGPRETLHLAGSGLSRIMFWVPQAGRVGLGVSILSYAGGVMVGVASDATLVPDPEAIVAAFEGELRALAGGERPHLVSSNRFPRRAR